MSPDSRDAAFGQMSDRQVLSLARCYQELQLLQAHLINRCILLYRLGQHAQFRQTCYSLAFVMCVADLYAQLLIPQLATDPSPQSRSRIPAGPLERLNDALRGVVGPGDPNSAMQQRANDYALARQQVRRRRQLGLPLTLMGPIDLKAELPEDW